ncbi:MAG: hypothetical protein WC284_13120, partial [Candidimonas sp.]
MANELVVRNGLILQGNINVRTYSITTDVSNGNIQILPNGSGRVILDGGILPKMTTGSNGQVLATNGSGVFSFSTRMVNLIDDTTPQLGGNLDVNGQSIITSETNGNIDIQSNGGNIILDNLIFPNIDGTANQTLATDGNGNILWIDVITPTSPIAYNGVNYNAQNTDDLVEHLSAIDTAIGIAGQSGIDEIIEDTTPTLGGDLDVNGYALVSSSGGDIVIQPDGQLILDSLIWPTTDGSDGQVLVTDGMGQLSWSTRMVELVDDITPFLGGDLDVNGYAIISSSGGDIVVQPDGQLLIGNISYPTVGGNDGQLVSFSSNDLIFSDLSKNKILYVDKNGNDTTGNGSINRPFLTISTALSNAVSDTVIYIGSGTFSENITIQTNNITLIGVGMRHEHVSIISGSITISSGITRLRIKDLRIDAQGSTPCIVDNGSAGRIHCDNVSFVTFFASTDVAYQINSGTRWHNFMDCEFNDGSGIVLNGVGSGTLTVWVEGGVDVGEIIMNHPDQFVYIENARNVGPFVHNDGYLRI